MHGEAALHGALGEQLQNCGLVPQHLRERHREPDEESLKTAVKTKAKKTNNQASLGGSILKANMEVEAAKELAHDLDQSGMHRVCLHRVEVLGFC